MSEAYAHRGAAGWRWQVWMDMPDAASPGELVGVYARSHDPDALAEDIEFSAHERGLA